MIRQYWTSDLPQDSICGSCNKLEIYQLDKQVWYVLLYCLQWDICTMFGPWKNWIWLFAVKDIASSSALISSSSSGALDMSGIANSVSRAAPCVVLLLSDRNNGHHHESTARKGIIAWPCAVRYSPMSAMPLQSFPRLTRRVGIKFLEMHHVQ